MDPTRPLRRSTRAPVPTERAQAWLGTRALGEEDSRFGGRLANRPTPSDPFVPPTQMYRVLPFTLRFAAIIIIYSC